MKKVYLNALTPEEIIARLKNGEVVKLPNCKDFKLKLIDRVLVSSDSDTITINAVIGIDKDIEDYYFAEEEKFEITETGLYRTRDFRKAFVSKVDKDGELCIVGIIDGHEDYSLWHKNGKTDPECDSDEDLFERIG